MNNLGLILAMALAGEKYKELTEALISAFPTEEELKKMVRYRFNENLETLTTDGNLEDIAFELVQRFEAEGRILELVKGARKENPTNPDLLAFERELHRKALVLKDKLGRTDRYKMLLVTMWIAIGVSALGVMVAWLIFLKVLL